MPHRSLPDQQGRFLVMCWCRRRDSNSHSFRHYPLKIACLPISPRRHGGLPSGRPHDTPGCARSDQRALRRVAPGKRPGPASTDVDQPGQPDRRTCPGNHQKPSAPAVRECTGLQKLSIVARSPRIRQSGAALASTSVNGVQARVTPCAAAQQSRGTARHLVGIIAAPDAGAAGMAGAAGLAALAACGGATRSSTLVPAGCCARWLPR